MHVDWQKMRADGVDHLPTPAPMRYEALDSIRGLAACLVVLFHMPNDGHSWALPIVRNGFLAVPFFFMLSGFVIGASYGERLSQGYSLKKFMFLRWGRIYPLHAFILAILIISEAIRLAFDISAVRYGEPFTGNFSLFSLLMNVLFLQEIPAAHSWNRPSWSIGVEFWTYLICALLLGYLRNKRFLPTSMIMIVPGAVYVMFGRKLGLELHPQIGHIVECCLGFGIGLAIYDLRRMGLYVRNSLSIVRATALELAAVIVCLVAMWTFGGKFSLTFYPAFAFAVFLFSSQAGYISRVIMTRPFLVLGTLSYSIYMVHQVIQDTLLQLIDKQIIPVPLAAPSDGRIVLSGNPWLCDAAIFAMLFMVVCGSWLSYQYVEEPARKWSRKIASRLD